MTLARSSLARPWPVRARLGFVRPVFVLALAFLTGGRAPGLLAGARTDLDARVETLETTLKQVLAELETLKQERDELRTKHRAETERADTFEQQQQALIEEVEKIQVTESPAKIGKSSVSFLPKGLHLGGYGEHHFNLRNGGGGISDLHRFVTFVGYDFAEWLHFNSETELEHAFVEDDDGELSLEQFYIDVNLSRRVNFRVGRVLQPAGIINRFHEPTRFYGVERPGFSTKILPSTWSVDGAGLWGQITDWLSYETYVHAGLDGSQFRASDGIRKGRLNERPSLNDIGVSSRIDFYPLLAMQLDSPVSWRTGFSYSNVGVQNSDEAKEDRSRPKSNVQIFAGDTDLRWNDWELRGELAYLDIPAANEPGVGPGTADEVFGAYGQLAYHFWPDVWKAGRLKSADAVAFVRYEYLDPQFGDVTFGVRDRTKTLRETVMGMSFFPVENLVFKADYVISDPVEGDAPNRYDFGVGYSF